MLDLMDVALYVAAAGSTLGAYVMWPPRRRKLLALNSAWRMGDASALEEMMSMNNNLWYSWVALLAAGTITIIGLKVCDYAGTRDEGAAQRDLVETRAQAERKLVEVKAAADRARAAYDLRLQYVRSCRMTPEAAEAAVAAPVAAEEGAK